MPILLILLLAGGALLMGSNISMISGKSFDLSTLPDCDPEDQGGDYKTTYDYYFKTASEKTGVPFALIKAHAIRESSLNPGAIRNEPASSKRPPSSSYGLMQILWWQGSNRFAKWGYGDDQIGDGTFLYQADVNSFLGAKIILENLTNLGNLRDAVNAYNTGVKESVRVAPGNYVDDVLKYYSELVGRNVT